MKFNNGNAQTKTINGKRVKRYQDIKIKQNGLGARLGVKGETLAVKGNSKNKNSIECENTQDQPGVEGKAVTKMNTTPDSLVQESRGEDATQNQIEKKLRNQPMRHYRRSIFPNIQKTPALPTGHIHS
jgi:hypothetical protein